MATPHVSGLFTHPVKSMQSTALREALITPQGIRYDRRFMLVDPDGNFITQRECPALATYLPTVVYEDGPRLRMAVTTSSSPIALPSADRWEEGERIQVTVWKDTVWAVVQSADLNMLLTHTLERPVRLVYLPDSSMRRSRGQLEGGQVCNGFSDGYPFLLTTQASLADLNARLGDEAVPMERFRPNIVIGGDMEAFAEETWRVFRIGDVTFYGMKRCGRCKITTTDQQTGARIGKEPLKTLASYRRFGNEACFGMNLNHSGPGTIRVGDTVEILEERPPFIEN